MIEIYHDTDPRTLMNSMLANVKCGNKIPLKVTSFPGGEVQVTLDTRNDPSAIDSLAVYAKLTSTADIMLLLLATDALRRNYPGKPIDLLMPYIPYARQDRITVPGESFSLKVFADLVKAQRYQTVTVCDAHSDVALALLDQPGLRHIPQEDLIVSELPTSKFLLAIAPDAGAIKKATRVQQVFNSYNDEDTWNIKIDSPICFFKKRDPSTGKLSGFGVDLATIPYGLPSVDEVRFVVVDDICDGGGTFMHTRKTLADAIGADAESLTVDLHVTHGIFSKGREPLLGVFNSVYSPLPF